MFASANMLQTYDSENEQYDAICGWCGTMSPLSRPAFVRTFGEDVTKEAEKAARADLDNWRKEYAASEWHQYKEDADRHEVEGQKVPAVGDHVWAWATWLKCDGGRGFMDEIRNEVFYEESDDLDSSPCRIMVHVAKVVNVSVDELDREALADELAADGTLPGGGCYEESRGLNLVAPYKLAFTNVVAVTDGTRYYFIDSEGYNYARYIMFPNGWKLMFADQLEAYRAKVRADKEAKEKAAKEEHAKEVAAYIGRCKKWEKLMQPVHDLQEQEKAAKYGTPEYRAVRRKLNNVRRANILTMCRAAFPGVKISLTKHDGWGEDWNITYIDGPTEAAFMEGVDLDLFCTHYDTFNGMDDSSDVEHIDRDFCDFAAKYMGNSGTGGIKVEREMSDATRADLRARVSEAVPGLSDNDSIHRDTLTGEQREAVCNLVGLDWSRTWINVGGLAAEMFDKMDLYTRPEKSPATAKKKATDGKQDGTDGKQDGMDDPGSLTAEEYSERATVVRGYDEAQYNELVAMGGKYNRRLKGGPGIIFSTKKHGEAVTDYIARHTA